MNTAIALVLVNSAIAFVLAFASILIIAAIARYLAAFFATGRASRIGAFGVAVGYVVGHFPGGTASTLKQLPTISPLLGAIAGSIAARAWLLKTGGGEVTAADR